MNLILCLFSILPQPHTPMARVDYCEVSHFYDDSGRLVFDQLIFYDWNGSEFEVRDWRLIKEPWQLPVRDRSRGGFYSHLPDTSIHAPEIKSTPINGVILRCRHSHERWDQYDPELLERENLPKEQRRELKFKQ